MNAVSTITDTPASEKLGQTGSMGGDPVLLKKTPPEPQKTPYQGVSEKLGQWGNGFRGVRRGDSSPDAPLPVGQAIREFLLAQERHGIRPHTCRHYRINLGAFRKFLETQGVYDLAVVTRKQVAAYREFLFCFRYSHKGSERALATHTQYERLSQIRRFFDYWVRAGNLRKNAAVGIELPKLPKRISANVLSEEEMAAFLAAMDLKTVCGFCYRTLFELAYATGLRSAELVGLETRDVNLEDGLLHIREGKGGEERMAVLTQISVALLRKYLAQVRALYLGDQTCPHLFPTRRAGPLIPRDLKNQLRTYARLAGIQKPFSFHAFRRSMATHLLMHNADLRHIQKLLGHKKLITTEGYLATTFHQERRVLLAYHPREKVFAHLRPKEETPHGHLGHPARAIPAAPGIEGLHPCEPQVHAAIPEGFPALPGTPAGLPS